MSHVVIIAAEECLLKCVYRQKYPYDNAHVDPLTLT